jgi:hypothetical protein
MQIMNVRRELAEAKVEKILGSFEKEKNIA